MTVLLLVIFSIQDTTWSVISQHVTTTPPLPTQRKIAAILSAYDDLIEKNTRRIALLEQTAQLLYREWFVHFRFPGHESAPLVESTLGKIPDGWSVCSLQDQITLDRGLSYKGKFLTEDGFPMINLKCILPGGGFREGGIKTYSGNYKPRQVVQPGDLVFANTDLTQSGNVIGSPAIVPFLPTKSEIIISHHLYAIRFKTESQLTKHYLYHLMLDYQFKSYAKGHASGTTVLGLRRDSVLQFPFAKPTLQVLESFEIFARPIYRLGELCHQRNTVLRRTRDLLLPRLISGQLDVSELEILTGECSQ